MLGSPHQTGQENLIRFGEEGRTTAPIPIPVQQNKENEQILTSRSVDRNFGKKFEPQISYSPLRPSSYGTYGTSDRYHDTPHQQINGSMAATETDPLLPKTEEISDVQKSPNKLEAGGEITQAKKTDPNETNYVAEILKMIAALTSGSTLALNTVLFLLKVSNLKNLGVTLPNAWNNATPIEKTEAIAGGGVSWGVQSSFNLGVVGEAITNFKSTYQTCETFEDYLKNTGIQGAKITGAAVGATPATTLSFTTWEGIGIINGVPVGAIMGPYVAAVTAIIFISSRYNGIHRLLNRIREALDKTEQLQDEIIDKLDRIIPDTDTNETQYEAEIDAFLEQFFARRKAELDLENKTEDEVETLEAGLYALCNKLETMANEKNIFADKNKLLAYSTTVGKVIAGIAGAIAAASVFPVFAQLGWSGFNIISGGRLINAGLWAKRGWGFFPGIISSTFFGVSNYDFFTKALPATIKNIYYTKVTGDPAQIGTKIKKAAKITGKTLGTIGLYGANLVASLGFRNVTTGMVETPENVLSHLGFEKNIAPFYPYVTWGATTGVNAKPTFEHFFPDPTQQETNEAAIDPKLPDAPIEISISVPTEPNPTSSPKSEKPVPSSH